jgi:ATP-dependent exoDNAse (exonuclease V) beta subunit
MMNFRHVKLSELDFDLASVTTEEGRRYTTPEGNVYPSITTVLSHSTDKTHLFEWRKRVGDEEANRITTKSSVRGTKLHTVCEKYLLNELTEVKINAIMPDIKDFFNQLRPHIDKNIGNVYGIEQPLYSDKYRLAGRTDCVAEWNGNLAVIDYKNSRKEKKEEWIENYFIQCTAYSLMFEERTKLPVEKIVVLIANEEGTPQVFVRDKSKYIASLEERIEKYWNPK